MNGSATPLANGSAGREGSVISICDDEYTRDHNFGYTLVALNSLSLFINVIHITVLSKMPSLKGLGYCHILVHLSLGDVSFSVYAILANSLDWPEYFQDASLAMNVLYYALMSALLWSRYWLMCAASLERYYALCHAMKYNTSLFIQKIRLWLVMVWLACLGLAAIRATAHTDYDTFCFSQQWGYAIVNAPWSVVSDYLGSGLPSLITGVSLALVVRELRRMRRRNLTQREKQTKDAIKYLLTIAVLYYSGFLPPLIGHSVIAALHNKNQVSFAINHYVLGYLPGSVYGVTNVIVYGWMAPAYRQRIRRMAKFSRRGNRVDIAPLNSGETPTQLTSRV